MRVGQFQQKKEIMIFFRDFFHIPKKTPTKLSFCNVISTFVNKHNKSKVEIQNLKTSKITHISKKTLTKLSFCKGISRFVTKHHGSYFQIQNLKTSKITDIPKKTEKKLSFCDGISTFVRVSTLIV